MIASKGKEITNWKIYQILIYCSCGIIAGMVGGLLGLGGGFILGPLFLELGIPPQVLLKLVSLIFAYAYIKGIFSMGIHRSLKDLPLAR